MRSRGKISMTTWIIVVVSALLLVLNGAFGLVMLHQSRAAIKTLIYSRMLDTPTPPRTCSTGTPWPR